MSHFKATALIAAAALACAPASTTGRVRHDQNFITKEEIATANVNTAYDAIMALRPSMIRFRGKTTITGSDTGYPKVYLDRQPFGDIESLKSIATGNIRSIRYFNAAEASTKFGLGNASGAIEVVTDAAN